MKNHFNKFLPFAFLSVAILFGSCKTSFDEIKYNDGDADFSRVIAIGSNHMAGYSDKALYREAQSNSIPALLATRFSLVGGGSFKQPLVNSGVGLGLNGNAKWILTSQNASCGNGTFYTPVTASDSGDVSNTTWLGNSSVFNNLAVPGTRIADITSQSYGDPSPFLGNPLYARFASNPGTSTISGDALLTVPSFFMIWLGMEDIYEYALSGGDEGNHTITASNEFIAGYSDLLNSLTSQDASGIVVNIPLPTAIPFFSAIPYNGLYLTATEAAELNVLYATVDPTIQFTQGYNRYVIADSSLSTGRRQILPGEMILLSVPQDSLRCFGLGRTVPISGNYILTAAEVSNITNKVIEYNSLIASQCNARDLALADISNYLNSLKQNIVFNGVTYSTNYLDGGVFSTDGYNLSQRGSALVANEMLKVINSFYNAKIPLIDVNQYPGIAFP